MSREARETIEDNNLFFTCSFIDYIARKTKNTRSDVVNKLGKERLQRIYELADVYHCDNISVIDSLIKVYNSYISPKIDDYNSSVYYENPSYIYECYKENQML